MGIDAAVQMGQYVYADVYFSRDTTASDITSWDIYVYMALRRIFAFQSQHICSTIIERRRQRGRLMTFEAAQAEE